MLACYLDDSGKDPQNPITTIAGFVARQESWVRFEEAVEPIFQDYGVPVFHASELHATKGPFADWPVLKKQSFLYKVCREMSPNVPLGVSMSAVKDAYEQRSAESQRKRTVRPYTFCFNVVIDWLLRDIRIGKLVHDEGLALIVEAGHENNPEAKQTFDKVRERHELQNVLKSLSFVPKTDSRAIQMADALAFFSRRHGVAMESAFAAKKPEPATGHFMNIISGAVPIRAFVATDFGDSGRLPQA